MVRIRIGKDELELTWEEWEARVRSGRIPPEALVSADALTGDQFVPAHTLEVWQSLRDEAALEWQRDVVRGGPPIATALLVGINLRVLWWQLYPGGRDMVDAFINWAPPTLEDGQSYRLLTMGILHQEIGHIALNLVFLAYTGWNLERALGRRNLLVMYLWAVLAGSLFSMFMSPWRPSLGASGGVFGFVAATIVFGFTRPELLPERGRRLFGWAMLPYLAISIWSGLQSDRTDNWAHFGGMLAGMALALILDPEPLQRRKNWNRAWRVGLVTGAAALLGAIAIAGPRIEYVAGVDEATEASIRRREVPLSGPATERYEALDWSVPAGWLRGATSAGDVGFASPLGKRAWSVRERRHDEPRPLEALATKWVDGLRVAFPELEASELAPATIAGRDGAALTVDIGESLLEWRGTTRGLWSLEEVWEVEKHRVERLEPLRDRLRASVRWDEPASLVAARATLKQAPESRRARSDFAQALAEAGETEASLTEWRSLVDQAPTDDKAWAGLLRTARWYPDAVTDPRALWREAIERHPVPAVLAEVALSLEAAGQPDTARALLDLAWARSPGDRVLKRTRRALGLPVELDEATHLPWEILVDPLTGERRSDEAARALAATPLTLDEAERWGRERAAQRAELERAAIAALDAVEVSAEPLLRLKHGSAPYERGAAVQGLAADLGTLAEGRAVPWMPEAVQEAARRRLQTDPGFATRLGG